MTEIGAELLADQRRIFERLAELEKTAPGDVDAIVAAVVSHLRAWRREHVHPLGALPPPTERIQDPRQPPDGE